MSEADLAKRLLVEIDAVRGRLSRITPDALFAELGLRRINEAPPGGQEGLYVRDFGGAVFLDPNIRTEERRLFTAFHEGSHAILDRDAFIREALAELCPDEAAERPVVELLCNLGAAEFLMPRAEFVPLLRGATSPVQCVEAIERQFPSASLPAIAQQIAHYASPPGMVLICHHAPIPCEGGFQRARTHVQYSFVRPVSGTKRVRPRPRRFQTLRDDHPLALMFDHRQAYSGKTYYPYSTAARIQCWCEAVWHSSSRRVVALLREEGETPAGPEQTRLTFE